jgi:hypothetical protein
VPFQHSIWRLDGGLIQLQPQVVSVEAEIEKHLSSDLRILDGGWLLVGRQVKTGFGKFIDLLAVDRDGTLIIIELKRDRTPREVVAQILDYASWVEGLESEDVAAIWSESGPGAKTGGSLDAAFQAKFGLALDEVDLNEAHRMVVVAARLDESTERIVSYLAQRSIPINVLFFQTFFDGDVRYLSRVWFQDPQYAVDPVSNPSTQAAPWNGEYYANFGEYEDRSWHDAIRYGFIASGGGRWYSRTLNLLEIGSRVWVKLPANGYAGVCIVEGPAVKADQFRTTLQDGRKVALNSPDAPLKAPGLLNDADDEDMAEYLVPVRWLKTLPASGAVHEVGFFGNQNSVCKPTTPKWNHTVERLKRLWDIP